jgi:hypothetical protein
MLAAAAADRLRPASSSARKHRWPLSSVAVGGGGGGGGVGEEGVGVNADAAVVGRVSELILVRLCQTDWRRDNSLSLEEDRGGSEGGVRRLYVGWLNGRRRRRRRRRER